MQKLQAERPNPPTKIEARNQKFETNSKFEKLDHQSAPGAPKLNLMLLDFEFVLSFEFRISNFPGPDRTFTGMMSQCQFIIPTTFVQNKTPSSRYPGRGRCFSGLQAAYNLWTPQPVESVRTYRRNGIWRGRKRNVCIRSKDVIGSLQYSVIPDQRDRVQAAIMDDGQGWTLHRNGEVA
jgi:hypothetical protein